MRPTIGVITTCKGRLSHLKQTLPLMAALQVDQVVVVDYGCPEGTGEWVRTNHPNVCVVSVDDDPGFCVARARNLGAAAVQADWLVFVDADIGLLPGFDRWLHENVEPGSYYRASETAGRRPKEAWGTAVCSRKAFEAIGGYDEVFAGWAVEDRDLYLRLAAAGFRERSYPAELLHVHSHGNELRTTFFDVKEVELHHLVNLSYCMAKKHWMRVLGGDGGAMQPPREQREALMARVRRLLLDEQGALRPPPYEPLTLKGRGLEGLPADHHLQVEVSVRLRVAPGTPPSLRRPRERAD